LAPTVEDLGLVLDREIDSGQTRRAERILELAEEAVAKAFKIGVSEFRSDRPPGSTAVVLSVAARAFENPLTLTSETAGPWSGSYRAGGFELTPYELRDLGVVDDVGATFDVGLRSPERYSTGHDDDPRVPEWIANG
jgi:hypothetical protein